MEKIIFVFLGFLLVASPVFAHAAVSVTEIAWMGSSTSQYEEWLELHNDGSDPINLAGWKILKGDSGTILFAPTGSISSGSYYVICRTTASLTNPLGGTCNEKGAFGGSGLSNSGEHLQIVDSLGSKIQDLAFLSGWPAGDSPTKKTMQWDGSLWTTAVATPGVATAVVSSDPDANNSQGSSDVETVTTTNSLDSVSDSKADISLQAHQDSIGGFVSMTSLPVDPDPNYSAIVTVPNSGTVGLAVPVAVEVRLNGHHDMTEGRFVWSFGDGGSIDLLQNQTLSHIYYYPGTYQIALTYYSMAIKKDPDYVFKKTIKILPASVEILGITDDGGISIKNDSSGIIDLGDWFLDEQGFRFVFPKNTFIGAGVTLSISSNIIGFKIPEDAFIVFKNPESVVVTSFPGAPQARPGKEPDANLIASDSVVYTPQSLGAGEDWSGLSHSFLGAQQSASPSPQSSLPKSQAHPLIYQYRWYLTAGILGILALVAYAAFHRYYKPSETEFDFNSEADEIP